VVEETQRGKGYGYGICAALLSTAQAAGARTAYLQVMQNNEIAQNLYRKLGFDVIYPYHYRVQDFKKD